MNKQLIIGLSALLIVVGAVTVARAESGGWMEVIKNAILGLDARVTNLEDEIAITDGEDLGGVSNFDVLSSTWIQSCAIASTTDSVYVTKIRLVLGSEDADDFWRNTMKGNAYARLQYATIVGTASSTFSL